MADQDVTESFRKSVLGIPDALNAYRAESDRPPLVANRLLNFNAFDRVKHLLEAGMADGSYLEDTVRPFEGQDVSAAVELVRQWPTVKDDAADYLTPWIKDELAHTVLMGEYGFVGIFGNALPLTDESNTFKGIVVLVMTTTQPRRP